MWIMLSDVFVSAVAYVVDPPQPDMLMVRARVRGDLERIFPRSPVTRTPDADYAYRTVVTRAAFKAMLAQEVDRVDYVNFKNSVSEGDRHDAYLRCWTAMMSFQNSRERPASKAPPRVDWPLTSATKEERWWQRDQDETATADDDWNALDRWMSEGKGGLQARVEHQPQLPGRVAVRGKTAPAKPRKVLGKGKGRSPAKGR